jgi:hypothetical protein
MQVELARSLLGSLGWRPLNERLHRLQELTPELDAQNVPPILQVE